MLMLEKQGKGATSLPEELVHSSFDSTIYSISQTDDFLRECAKFHTIMITAVKILKDFQLK